MPTIFDESTGCMVTVDYKSKSVVRLTKMNNWEVVKDLNAN